MIQIWNTTLQQYNIFVSHHENSAEKIEIAYYNMPAICMEMLRLRKRICFK